MYQIKLSSEEVPAKFVEWLLAMGCPVSIVPSADKVSEMCRGHYMVWRSMMEHVDAKDVIIKKRLQVFCDDIRQFEKKNKFTESDSSTTEPEQLKLWRLQREMTLKVADAKLGVETVKHDFKQLSYKVEGKMLQLNSSRAQLEDIQRRSWLLQQLSVQLQTKQSNLKETQAIADSLCCIKNETEVDAKLDKCIHSLRRHVGQYNGAATANTTVSSTSSANGDSDLEENLSGLVKCHGDVLCTKLNERRASLIKALSETNESPTPRAKTTPSSVVTHTAGLHCALTLEASKNRLHLKHARRKIVDSVTELNNYLTGESCELLVIRSEKAHIEARVRTLRTILDELIARSGVFQVCGEEDNAPLRPISAINKAIENKRDELKKLISCLAATERKIQNVRECLGAVFNAFHDGLPAQDWDKYRGLQLELPVEPISSVRQYYEAALEKKKAKLELTMEMDESENSLNDTTELTNPKYIDELKVFLKKFNLEINRKLVLESGEQIWIFETLQASLFRVHTNLLSHDVTSSLLTSSDSLSNNLRGLAVDLEERRKLEELLKVFEVESKGRILDITQQTQEEEEVIDIIRKRLTNSIFGLEKANKTLDLAQNNLKLWSNNQIKKYISTNRKVKGLTYSDFELYYLDNCAHI